VVEEAHKLDHKYLLMSTECLVVQEEEVSIVQLVVQEILPLQILLKVLLEVMEDHVHVLMVEAEAAAVE
jgi:hypothetical protein